LLCGRKIAGGHLCQWHRIDSDFSVNFADRGLQIRETHGSYIPRLASEYGLWFLRNPLMSTDSVLRTGRSQHSKLDFVVDWCSGVRKSRIATCSFEGILAGISSVCVKACEFTQTSCRTFLLSDRPHPKFSRNEIGYKKLTNG
jgi:hypothetical protein